MAEAYKKIGRGGAGNFWSKQDIAEASKAGDNEAGTASTAADLTKAISASVPPSEYQHTGRGGAGNWVKPNELETQGLSQATSSDPALAPSSNGVGVSKRVLGGNKPILRSGRGGAGNYSDVEADERARKDEEERLRLVMEKRVQADVEQGLSRPPRAYGGIGGAWEMGSMKEDQI